MIIRQSHLTIFLFSSMKSSMSKGIGLPGVAGSGTIAANTIASVDDHINLVKDLKKKGILQ
jgi:hypothetical protein